MIVTGPNWPSTAALKAALEPVQSEKILNWGARGLNKIQELDTLKTNNIRCPVYTTNKAEAMAWVREKINVFGRRINHTQGLDIVGPGYGRQGGGKQGRMERWNNKWLNRDYWVKVIPIAYEFRQHIWNGKAIRVGRKVQTGPTIRVMPVRSRLNGWTIDYGFKPEEDLQKRIREISKAAVAACGYLGGAVDLALDTAGELWVLEINTAPALRDEHTLGAYVKGITMWATGAKPSKKVQGT